MKASKVVIPKLLNKVAKIQSLESILMRFETPSAALFDALEENLPEENVNVDEENDMQLLQNVKQSLLEGYMNLQFIDIRLPIMVDDNLIYTI